MSSTSLHNLILMQDIIEQPGWRFAVHADSSGHIISVRCDGVVVHVERVNGVSYYEAVRVGRDAMLEMSSR